MNDDRHTLRADGITATIRAHGAELCSLRNEGGLELLWQAGRSGRVMRLCCFRSSVA
jgi:hypothetical protein